MNAQQPTYEKVISARSAGRLLDFGELFQYRDLLWLLVAREIRGRYRQSLLGPAWAIIQPMLTMFVFTVLFGLLLGNRGMPTPEGIPYAISTYCALVPWQLFTKSASNSSNSIVTLGPMITKVYFPRIIAPSAAVLSAFVDFVLAFLVLAAMMVWYGFLPSANIVFLPLFIVLAIGVALAVGLWFCGLNAVLRDVGYGLPALLQIAMYATPVVYSASSMLPALEEKVGSWAVTAYWLNPMAGVVEGFRWCLLGAEMPPLGSLFASVGLAIAALISGLWVFRKMEPVFVDVV